MRIRSISVTKLFGIFDHVIPLNMKERITIIHGLNGYGKTVILRMIYGVMKGSYEVFASVPFSVFEIHFDDDAVLRVQKVEGPRFVADNGVDRPWIELFFRNAAGPHDIYEPETMTDLLPSMEADGLDDHWFDGLRRSMSVELIETQRLKPENENWGFASTMVEQYSSELSMKIKAALAEYARRSQELDRTFPVRLLQQTEMVPLSAPELRSRLGELEKQRTRLATLGFLDPEETLADVPQTIEPSKLGVLTIYVRDMEEKLRGFDDLAARIELFVTILNDRFSYKRVNIHRDKGFIFVGPNGALVPLAALSSGEQHEIVLLYDLLFRLPPDSLILIDEPEISLHVTWQQEFVNDLEKVVNLSGVDVLLATHLPEIIGEHWDWTVPLKGPAT